MFGARYFGSAYYGPRYWGRGGDDTPIPPTPTDLNTFHVGPQGKPRRIPAPIFVTVATASGGNTTRAFLSVETFAKIATAHVSGSAVVECDAGVDVLVETEQRFTMTPLLASAKAMALVATKQGISPTKIEMRAETLAKVRSVIEAEAVPTYDGPDGFDPDQYVSRDDLTIH